jgi:hypothetical protein
MRRLLSIGTLTLAGLVAVPGALGAQAVAARTPGSVQLSLQAGRGLAVIQLRGALLGRIRAGRIVATRNVAVRCWKYRTKLASGLIRYRGRGEDCASITLYVSSQNGDAPWHVRIRGRGINVSGVARGSLTLDGANTGPTGTYSIGGRAKKPWPRDSRTFALAQ